MDTELPDVSAIRWQCRRGMLELDIILLSFFDERYKTLSVPQQKAFVQLLEFPDQELYQWVIGRSEPSDPMLQSIIEFMRQAAWKE